jgi:hypothetical protein
MMMSDQQTTASVSGAGARVWCVTHDQRWTRATVRSVDNERGTVRVVLDLGGAVLDWPIDHVHPNRPRSVTADPE